MSRDGATTGRRTMPALVRGATLAAIAVALALAPRAARDADAPCRTPVGACARPGVPLCGRTLGPWQVTRSRAAGLPAAHGHSACVLAPGPLVALVPQQRGVSGDTLLSRRPAVRADRQRATVTLATRGALPDHWVFALAGSFLDHGAAPACDGLRIAPPVNAGWALIGSNWASRPHGFYFERLADACVLDGTRPECPGPHAFLPHDFVAGEAFALDLALAREGDGWWLEANVAVLDDGGGTSGPRRRELGRMRQRVPSPCWLAPGDPGRALVLVIPDHDAPEARVEVTDFAWLE